MREKSPERGLRPAAWGVVWTGALVALGGLVVVAAGANKERAEG